MFNLIFDINTIGRDGGWTNHFRGMYSSYEKVTEFINKNRTKLAWFKLTYERDCPLVTKVQENDADLFYNSISCWYKKGDIAYPFDPRDEFEKYYHDGCEELGLPKWKYLKEFINTKNDLRYSFGD